MSVRDGYKMTELGEIPQQWKCLGMEEILLNKKGAMKIGPFGSQLKKNILVEHGKKVYGQENVFENDFVLGNRYVTEDKFEELKSCELFSGDVVISMMGTIGKCTIVPENIDQGIMDSHLLRLQVDEEKFNKVLLKHIILGSDIIKRQIKKLCVGGIMDGLSSTIIRQLRFPCPTLPEQQRIAEILSSNDAVITKTDELIEKTKEVKQGLMQELLTKGIGHTEFKDSELGRIPKDWEVKNLEDIVLKITDGTHKTPKYMDEGIPFLRVTDIQRTKIDWDTVKYISKEEHKDLIKRCNPEKGDILYSKNGTIGIPKIIDWDNEFSIFVSLCLIKIKKNCSEVINKYLEKFLASDSCLDQIRLRAKQGTVTNLHLEEIRKILIPIPSKGEQQQIAEILTVVDNKLQALTKRKQQLEEIKQGLMQDLLTGRVRVNSN